LDWTGKTVWSVQVNQQKNTYGMGGGLATDGERVYVTTPHNWVLALECSTGKVVWSYRLMHPARNGLAVAHKKLALLTLSNQTVVLDACTGKEVWDDQGMREDILILGGSIPAVTKDRVIVAAVSGEIIALSLDSGDRLWDRPLATISSAEGEKNFRHLQASPVVVGSNVYTTSDHGHIMCCDLYSGDILWSRDAGGTQTPIVVGDVLIALTSTGRCVAIDRHTGKEYWTITLPESKPESNQWFGPVMAGDLLYILSADGQLRAYDPYQKGAFVSQQSISDGYTMAPIPINGGLLLFSENGYLSFYQRKFTKNTCKVGKGQGKSVIIGSDGVIVLPVSP
jgi:outer membrane protein assembly factor BamB